MALTRSEISIRYRKRHPERVSAYRESEEYRNSQKQYRNSEKGKNMAHDHHLRYMYGRTLLDKAQQFESQKGLCGVCQQLLPNDLKKCQWDHSHKTNEMRDLLHSYCNKLVGALEDPLYPATVAYLKKYNDQTK